MLIQVQLLLIFSPTSKLDTLRGMQILMQKFVRTENLTYSLTARKTNFRRSAPTDQHPQQIHTEIPICAAFTLFRNMTSRKFEMFHTYFEESWLSGNSVVTHCVTSCHILSHIVSRTVSRPVTYCHILCQALCHVLSHIVTYCVTYCVMYCRVLSRTVM
jgi:hypothetical protein